MYYPGEDGPVNSIRVEIMRDGSEDYDMLAMLREARKAASPERQKEIDKLLNFSAITSDWETYLDNPAPLEQHRQETGNLLEGLHNE